MPIYYRYTIQGRHTLDTAQAALGPAASHGLIVRLSTRDKETHVIMAADTLPGPEHAPTAGAHLGGVVQEAEVLRID
jgi:hypothetical protein